MKGFKSHKQSQIFLLINSQINNLFNLGHHLLKAKNYRVFREQALNEWIMISCA